MKILHCADLHIRGDNLQDYLDSLDEIIESVFIREADLLLICGDIFHSRNPGATQLEAFAMRMRYLAERDVEVGIVCGNHDMPATTEASTSLGAIAAMRHKGIHIWDKPTLTKIKGMNIVAMPYPLRGRLLAVERYRNLPMREVDDKLLDMSTRIILALENDVPRDEPSIFAGHFSVTGAVYPSGMGTVLGNEIVIPRQLFDHTAFNYIAMGHIHKYQEWDSGGLLPIVYSGGMQRNDFGEEHDAKGYVWVEIEPDGTTTHEFVPLKSTIRYLTIDVGRFPGKDLTHAALEIINGYDVTDAIVRVRIKLPEGMSVDESTILKSLSGARYVQGVYIERQMTDRARLNESAETLTEEELLGKYLVSLGHDQAYIEKAKKYAREEVLNESS